MKFAKRIGLKSCFINRKAQKEWNNWAEKEIELNKTNEENNLELFQKIVERKSSDTLFIMGSGTSINKLTPKDIEYIFSQDTFGLNQFFVFPEETTFHHFECYPNKVDVHLKWLKNLENRSTIWMFNGNIIEASHKKKIHNQNANILFTYAMESWGKTLLVNKIISHIQKRAAESKLSYLHYRGSLTIPISLAVGLGYKRVVLVGVDLEDYKYFYEDEKRYSCQTVIEVLKELEERRLLNKHKSIHATNDPTLYDMNYTISQIMQILAEELEIEISCWNPQSALNKVLPIFHYDA